MKYSRGKRFEASHDTLLCDLASVIGLRFDFRGKMTTITRRICTVSVIFLLSSSVNGLWRPRPTLCSIILLRMDRARWISEPVLVVSNNCCGHSTKHLQTRPAAAGGVVSAVSCQTVLLSSAEGVTVLFWRKTLSSVKKAQLEKKTIQTCRQATNRMCLSVLTLFLFYGQPVFFWREKKNSCMISGLELITSKEYFDSFNSCSPSFCLK